MGTVYYKLGAVGSYSGTQVLHKVVETIPSTWHSVTGMLYAPQMLVDNGRVLADTGYAFGAKCDGTNALRAREQSERHDIDPTIDLAGFVQGKRPAFVSLQSSGAYGKDCAAFVRAKMVTIGYLELGYRGNLDFFRDSYGPACDYTARCQLRADPADTKQRPLRPWYLKLEWNEKLSGSRDHVSTIMHACKSLGLSEMALEPQSSVSTR